MNIKSCSTLFAGNYIVGCDVSWLEPGLNAPQDPFCDIDNGYRICDSVEELVQLGLTPLACLNTAQPNTIYISKVNDTDNIYGCGTIGFTNGALPVIQSDKFPFSYSLNREKIRLQKKPHSPWQADNASPFIDNVYKLDDTQGGILCCRYMHDHRVTSGTQWAEFAVFFVACVLIAGCALKFILVCLEYLTFGTVPRFLYSGRCCESFNCNGIIICCGRYRIPVTKNAYIVLKRERDIDGLSCRTYSELLDGRRVSKNSQCVICLDSYEDDSNVTHLKCGHHFHKECCRKWLLDHQNCPICLQNFQKAQNKYNKPQNEKKELLIATDINFINLI